MFKKKLKVTSSSIIKNVDEEEKVEPKIRIIPDEELNLRVQGLKEIRDILNRLEIPYYLEGGALLGFVRDGDFIRWDPDVAIDLKSEYIYPKRELLKSALESAGFEIVKYYPNKINFKICVRKYGTKYDIAGYYKFGKMRYRKMSYYPDAFIKNQSEIILRGEKFKSVGLPEKYLEWFYGDYKTPIKSVVPESYVTTKSRTSIFMYAFLKIISWFY